MKVSRERTENPAADFVAFLIDFHEECDAEGLRHSYGCWQSEGSEYGGCELTAKVRELEKAHGLDPYVWVDPYPPRDVPRDEFSSALLDFWNRAMVESLSKPHPFAKYHTRP